MGSYFGETGTGDTAEGAMGPLRGRRISLEYLQSEKPEWNNPEFLGIGEGNRRDCGVRFSRGSPVLARRVRA